MAQRLKNDSKFTNFGAGCWNTCDISTGSITHWYGRKGHCLTPGHSVREQRPGAKQWAGVADVNSRRPFTSNNRASPWIVIRDTNCPPPPSTTRSFRQYLGQATRHHQFALFTNPPLAGAASLSVQYWDRKCNCCFFFISTKLIALIFNTEYAT